MSDVPVDERAFSVFVSYARLDDVDGWVTSLVAALIRELDRSGDRDARVFFDRHDIHTYEQWWPKIQRAVREAPTMLACASRQYFDSPMCLREFREFEGRPQSTEVASGLVPVLLELTDTEGMDEERARWHGRVHDEQAKLVLRDEFAAGRWTAELDERVAGLADELHRRRQDIRRWEGIPSNVPKGTPQFVGRQDELKQLDEVLSSKRSVGVVTAVRGLGGIGKTELVRYYSRLHKGRFAAGTWLVEAEGAREILPLLAQLATVLPGFVLPEEARGNPEEAGRCVLRELRRRMEGENALLLILDNVDQAKLLSKAQLALLPEDRGFHVAVTTRLGHGEIPERDGLVHVPLEGLKPRDAVALLRALQPDRQRNGQPDFASEDEEQAAFELAELLGGFTLAVEQAGVYLKSHEELSVRDYLEHLRQHGALTGGEMLEDEDKNEILHREKLLSVILDDTMRSIDEFCPGSVKVLKLAAAMPPEMIPWPWLEDLAREMVPEVFEASRQHPKGRWDRIRRVLEGRGLIAEGKYPGVTGRMHRLVAEHLNRGSEGELERVDEHVMACAGQLSSDFTSAPNLWEVDALLEALARPLAIRPERFGEIPNFFTQVAAAYVTDARPVLLVEAVVNTLPRESSRIRVLALSAVCDLVADVDPGRALALAEEALEVSRVLVEAQPQSLQARRDLSVSLNTVGGLVADVDPGRALRLAEESLQLARVLVEEQPGNLLARRDLTVLLNTVGDLVVGSDPGWALVLAEESLEVARVLVEAEPDSLRARRDLSVSLGRVGDLVAHFDSARALEMAEEALELRQVLTEAQPRNVQALRDLGVAAARLAQLVPDSPEVGSFWGEAAVSFRVALEIQPDHSELGEMSRDSARRYAETGPSDRDEWLAYAAGLAERFGFGPVGE
ncbi:toll/interleukin-1 receptor domain-containing protein [Arachnia propionica]|uniref:TIR domain-containing protein n=1 Tax=Arachnia propionica TaxID=1750 RepID=A0A3P1WN34_9ACTN|nr:toll/interleukin-1 receptor domain-containing protein [Arachnia propionica]RRD47217.1 TIR domain-containing protein [Arachnia propionica]